MDHNLEDSLNLESAMSSMDFDHSEVEVNQVDITFDGTEHDNSIPMEFVTIEDPPIHMDTGGGEEIIDFMGDQFSLQEYSTQSENSNEVCVDTSQLGDITLQPDSMSELQFDADCLTQNIKQEPQTKPTYISVKTGLQPTRVISKRTEVIPTNAPRQVAIAPKPPKLAKGYSTFTSGKQYAIAPKPVTLVVNKNNTTMKKVSLANIAPGKPKGTTVLAQIGKQLVVVPTSGGQKVKLVSAGSSVPGLHYVRSTNAEQGQIVSGKTLGTNKPIVTKVIMQGQSGGDSSKSSLITKMLPNSNSLQARYVMQQKTVPISIGNNVVMGTPTKQGIRFTKKQHIIAIKSPTSTVLPTTSQGTAKKLVIKSNPNQNVILKSTAPPKIAQVSKESVAVQGQRSQLHQINVPGKGIQYIRLFPNTPVQKPVIKTEPPTPALAVPSKSFVLTDGKGNLIQMSAEKILRGQPPPLVLTGSGAAETKMITKPQKKLVRLAPISAKPSLWPKQTPRSSQSLLAPIVNKTEGTQIITMDELNELIENRTISASEIKIDTGNEGAAGEAPPHEVKVEFESQPIAEDEDTESSMDPLDTSNEAEEHLIVIPANFKQEENKTIPATVCAESEILPYDSPRSQQTQSENGEDVVSTDLGMRPRKACNCTKSQCLKLYCDCFANGEFCNQCNCNNCHNNLQNEELRQKAIRACLDRNPNAFRPKIGKSKSGGPDIIRRHNKGCNCKRSGCLKNYCECYEAKIACTAMCKCVGCRNVEETLERRRDAMRLREKLSDPLFRPPPVGHIRQPCSFLTSEVIEAVCQCLIAVAMEGGEDDDADVMLPGGDQADPMRNVIEEFARCLQNIINASHQTTPLALLDEDP